MWHVVRIRAAILVFRAALEQVGPKRLLDHAMKFKGRGLGVQYINFLHKIIIIKYTTVQQNSVMSQRATKISELSFGVIYELCKHLDQPSQRNWKALLAKAPGTYVAKDNKTKKFLFHYARMGLL